MFTPNNDLERLLIRAQEAYYNLGVFMQRLMVSNVVVLFKQEPDQQLRPLTITDAQGRPVWLCSPAPSEPRRGCSAFPSTRRR
jgi:hypothetical protein